jgi:hypothetical protein
VIRYKVSEAVGGRFDVLVTGANAHRLGLSSGSVIGHAIVETTRGGSGRVTIHFSKRIAAKLRKAHSITVTLRLTVIGPDLIPTVIPQTLTLHG